MDFAHPRVKSFLLSWKLLEWRRWILGTGVGL